MERPGTWTQNTSRLVAMLYDGAIKFLKLAVGELTNQNCASQNSYVNRARDILNELGQLLDMRNGGEAAQNLQKLYDLMNHQLTEANARRDSKMIQKVINLLKELQESL